MNDIRPSAEGGQRVLILRSEGRSIGRRVNVDRSPFILGRGSRADLEVETDRASRAHARIERVDGEWRVTDLSSANGTYLNGELLRAPRALTSGDVIAIGLVELEWHVLTEEGPTSTTLTQVLDPE